MKKLLLTAAALAAMASSAFAQEAESIPCGAYDLTIQSLVDDRGEVKLLELETMGAALDNIDHAEFWLNLETGSYTYLFVHVDTNFTCIGDSGEGSRKADLSETPAPTPDGEDG